MSRRDFSFADEVAEAKVLAHEGGLKLELLDVTAKHFRLSKGDEWSVELWPTSGKQSRVLQDPNKPGPFLALRRHWRIADAVRQAVAAAHGQQPVGDGVWVPEEAKLTG